MRGSRLIDSVQEVPRVSSTNQSAPRGSSQESAALSRNTADV